MYNVTSACKGKCIRIDEGGCQYFETDHEKEHLKQICLCGHTRGAGVEIGNIYDLEYRVTISSGLWFVKC